MAERTAVVVGGGIGGLAAAVALRQRGWRVTVLERSGERPGDAGVAGAGLSLWPNAMRALGALGLAGRVAAAGEVEAAGGLRDRHGRWLVRTGAAAIERRYGWAPILVPRWALLRELAGALPERALWTGHPARLVRPGGGASGPALVRAGGVTMLADLVVAADGVRSGIRQQCWPEAPAPRYLGYAAWRMVTDPLAAPPDHGAEVWGRGARFGYVAMPGRRVYCFATATLPPGGEGGHDELLRRFGGWPEPVPALLAAVPPAGVLRHDGYDLPPLRGYARGRVALLGDAAHAMDPSLGQGGCQALEDAVTLAACLDRVPGVPAALAEYDRVRRPRTQAVARRAARLGRLGQWAGPVTVAARDAAARLVPAGLALRAMAPVLGWVPPEPVPAPDPVALRG